MDKLGLTDVEMDSVLTLVLTHAEGTSRIRANQTQSDTGISDTEWWVVSTPLLEKVTDTQRFPVAARRGQSAGQAYQGVSDPAHAPTFSLDRILGGVALLINERQKSSGFSEL
ncbi:hypothetical protein [Spirosoma arcticum]